MTVTDVYRDPTIANGELVVVTGLLLGVGVEHQYVADSVEQFDRNVALPIAHPDLYLQLMQRDVGTIAGGRFSLWFPCAVQATLAQSPEPRFLRGLHNVVGMEVAVSAHKTVSWGFGPVRRIERLGRSEAAGVASDFESSFGRWLSSPTLLDHKPAIERCWRGILAHPLLATHAQTWQIGNVRLAPASSVVNRYGAGLSQQQLEQALVDLDQCCVIEFIKHGRDDIDCLPTTVAVQSVECFCDPASGTLKHYVLGEYVA